MERGRGRIGWCCGSSNGRTNPHLVRLTELVFIAASEQIHDSDRDQGRRGREYKGSHIVRVGGAIDMECAEEVKARELQRVGERVERTRKARPAFASERAACVRGRIRGGGLCARALARVSTRQSKRVRGRFAHLGTRGRPAARRGSDM